MKKISFFVFFVFPTFFSYGQQIVTDKAGNKWAVLDEINNIYKVERSTQVCREIGQVKSLNPFIKIGTFHTLNQYSDTVFVEEYDKNGKLKKYYGTNRIKNSEKIYNYVEEMPEFEDGEMALKLFIAENYCIPFSAEDMIVSGTSQIRFIVTSKSKIANIEVVKGTNYLFDKEAMKVVSIIPDFKPGKQDGKPVNVWFSLPVHIDFNY